MKKLNFTFLLTVLLSMVEVMTFAQTFSVGDINYEVTSEENLTVKVGNNRGFTGEAVIPKTVEYDGKQYSVTSISSSAFRDCPGLTSIAIPNSVTYIEMNAFSGCSGLTSMIIPNSVTYIEGNAFLGCSGLISLTIGNSVIAIGGQAFLGCSSLTSITIPNSVMSIGRSAFGACSSLETAEFHCKEIGDWFRGMKNLKNVVIGDEVTSIGSSAFEDCSGLTSVTIPNSVISIGESAFSGCTGIETVEFHCKEIGNWFSGKRNLKNVVFGYEVTTIGNYAFYDCSGLTSVTIPNSVSNIGESAFRNCRSLTSIEIPNSVTNIGREAFYSCTGLTSVMISNGVTDIGEYEFNDCSGLTSIVVDSDNTKYDSRENCNAIIEKTSNTLIVGCKNTIIPNSVTSIGNNAFYQCSGLTSVTIPNSVTKIGSLAFSGCSSLISVTIPNSVTTIGERAFIRCTSLTSVTIPNSVTSIGRAAFGACSDLTEVISLIKEPFSVDTNCWTKVNTDEIPLYVPIGTKEKYEATEGWNVFKNIVERDDNPEEEIDPVDEGDNVDFGSDMNENDDLDGNVIGDIFYNIGNGNGEYNAEEGCIVLKKTTDDETVDGLSGKDIFGEDFKGQFTGIVFKVPSGKGTVKVTAETTGNMLLKVKIGDGEPVEMELNGKLKISFPYNVSETTLVAIYAGANNEAKGFGTTNATDDAALKIYGIEFERGETTSIGASLNDNGKRTNDSWYTIDGKKLSGEPTKKGVYIIKGKKVKK